MTENELSRMVVDAAVEVHRTLTEPGLAQRRRASALRLCVSASLRLFYGNEIQGLVLGRALDRPVRMDL